MIDRERDTDPVPKDPAARLAHDVAELQRALLRVGDLVGKVNHSIAMLNLAERTIEHRVNTIQDVAEVQGQTLADHERRLVELEVASAAE